MASDERSFTTHQPPTTNDKISAAPTGSMSAGVDVDVRRTVAVAGVDTKPTDEIRVALLHRIHRARDDLAVRACEPAVAVGIDDDVRGVAVLVAAVTSRASHLCIVSRG